MKLPIITTLILAITFSTAFAQDKSVIPKPKTKEERKKMTLEQKIEEALPIDITLPKANVKLPGNNQISSFDDAKKFVNETLPDIGVKTRKQLKKAKDAAKRVADAFDGKKYEGIPVEKKVVKKGSGSKLRYTEIYVLKDKQAKPNPFVRTIYWFDEKKERVVEALTRDRENNLLMHGPYRDYIGDLLVEEGYYYLGAKDGVWAKYDKDFNLVDKATYRRGFLEGSLISYYDTDSTKIKEVMPNWYGQKSGDYVEFYPSGVLKTQGAYDNGVKVGKWLEYYPTGNRRKREMQYGLDCFDTMEPYLVREYDESGKITYQKEQ